jgi:glycosyltransferase involved in cell wall biosynthesis
VPLLSILSAVYPPTATYLPHTIESVRQQALPEGWTLEWVVQEDGDKPCLGELFAQLPYVRYAANGRHLGPAVTRNLGLSRVNGDLVQLLDHDDVLLPSALATLVGVFEHHTVHWAVGQADDLLPDDQRVGNPSALPFGFLMAGQMTEWAMNHAGTWPVHATGLMVHTAALRAIGGWPAIPVGDDVAMFGALAETTDGYNDPAVTWLYRHHPNQNHESPAARAGSADGKRIALQRVTALRAAWRLHVDPAPAPAQAANKAAEKPAEKAVGTEKNPGAGKAPGTGKATGTASVPTTSPAFTPTKTRSR